MKQIITAALLLMAVHSRAQQFPNNEFKKWDDYDCPEDWHCNNDPDCKGKITMADKIKGGARLTVMHCFDPKKEDRSNNVNMNYDDLSAKIPKGKKVKISFVYSYAPVGNDISYIKIDADFDEEINNAFPQFMYNGSSNGILKPGDRLSAECVLDFNPKGSTLFTAPADCNANSIRTAFGIMPAKDAADVHKGSSLIIHHIKFEIL